MGERKRELSQAILSDNTNKSQSNKNNKKENNEENMTISNILQKALLRKFERIPQYDRLRYVYI